LESFWSYSSTIHLLTLIDHIRSKFVGTIPGHASNFAKKFNRVIIVGSDHKYNHISMRDSHKGADLPIISAGPLLHQIIIMLRAKCPWAILHEMRMKDQLVGYNISCMCNFLGSSHIKGRSVYHYALDVGQLWFTVCANVIRCLNVRSLECCTTHCALSKTNLTLNFEWWTTIIIKTAINMSRLKYLIKSFIWNGQLIGQAWISFPTMIWSTFQT